MTQPALFPKTQLPRNRHKKDTWLNQLPNWLADHIESIIPRLTETANLTPCPKCNTPTLQALNWDLDYCAPTTTDTTLLTTNQEIQALTTGRTTHQLHITAKGITINQRNTWNLTAHQANTNPNPIAPNHKCHQPIGIPIPWTTLYPTIHQNSIWTDPNQPPPF